MQSTVLADDNSPMTVRNVAGLALKNFSTRSFGRSADYDSRWLHLSTDKTKIKNDALATLGSSAPRAGAVASQVISAIAAVELPAIQWGDLIEILLGFLNTQTNANLRIATLQTIGFICESIKPEILTVRANEIPTAVVHGARKEETSSDQLAAIHALYNSLESVRDNFEREVVCEATQNSAVQVQVAASECLVRIMGLYYDKMSSYMEQALFGLTSVALQAVEFWSTVCEEEVDLAIEAEEAQAYGESTENESKNFAQVALPEIVPVLLQLGTCISLLAGAVQDSIAHIKSNDWHHRDAAVMTFGSILEGLDPVVLAPLTAQALPSSDRHDTIKPDVHLHALISALVSGLSDEDHPRIVSNCCWALMNLAEQLGSFHSEVQTGPLSPYTEGVVQAFLRVTENPGNEHTFRTAAYEAISAYLSGATVDTIHVVQNTVVTVLNRMEQLLSLHNQGLCVDDRNNWNELQSNFCSVLIQIAGKTSTVLEDAFLVVGALAAALVINFSPYIQAFLPFLYPALKAHEDTQLCTVAVGIIGDISSALVPQVAPYANQFMTVLLENLQSEVLNRNVKISILSGFGDITMAIGVAFEPFLETTMSVLRQAGALQPNSLDYDLMDYVGQLREGILEAYTGLVGGFKATDVVSVLLPYVDSIFELIHRCFWDEERTDTQMKLSHGLIGDLAEALTGSPQLKQSLMKPWIAQELRAKHRTPE
ncbi:importin N-terminal domain-containing protein [Favolaschia claudopus]|uniref:Importin N-terminal domain-containing protein n=1 Tax=Favolaschia claudopus TaxID=2862362 RepID=A0AAV9ZUY9_9AGAR